MNADSRCYRCSRVISRAELEDGLVIETDLGLICADCITRERAKKDAPSLSGPRMSYVPAEETDDEGYPTEDEPGDAYEEDEDEDDGENQEDAGDEEVPEDQNAREEDERLYEDDPEAILLRILEELKPIRQAVYYHNTSMWNVLGGVVQIFAISLVALAVLSWSAGPTDFLLLAVFAQLLAFTCFHNGK